MKKFLKFLFRRLGYRIIKERFKDDPKIDFYFTYLDIGASNGLSKKWEKYKKNKFFQLILVEPDIEEAERLKALYPTAKVISHALGSQNHRSTLNMTYYKQCSSILEPNFEVLNRFPVKKWFEVTRKTKVDIFRFDSLLESMHLKKPDFIKIDVQGYESEVLEGFGKCLEDVLAIELETHLLPIYKNQKTLEDMNRFLAEKGFFLRHLFSGGPFEGEVVEFDAYFVKRPELINSDIQKKKIKLWERVNKIPEASLFAERDTF